MCANIVSIKYVHGNTSNIIYDDIESMCQLVVTRKREGESYSQTVTADWDHDQVTTLILSTEIFMSKSKCRENSFL